MKAAPTLARRPSLPHPLVLYARSRALPGALAALVVLAAFCAWASDWLRPTAQVDPGAGVPVLLLGSLLASGIIGTGLHTHTDALDRTAVAPWWRRRLMHLAGLSALAAGLLACTVLGHPDQFGPSAMIRNVLGATGLAAAGATLLGARLSWLPMTAYASAVGLAAPRCPGGWAAVWAWPVQPGSEAGAWATALAVFAVGGALYVGRGARSDRA
ncbi:hypothetical protein ACQPZG_11475 [Streptomyces sp. CA-294286]|uniref:hypothetical protein n=1 Tax=Streptomyces sp. CA-294286 TaxID=3240070 RepID=UPI003D8D2C50